MVANGPVATVPLATPSMKVRCSRMPTASQPARSAARASSSRWVRAARKVRGRQKRMSPAFTNSSRSMSGTTRTTAYSKGLRDGGTLHLAPRPLGLVHPDRPRLEPDAKVAPVRVTLVRRAAEASVAQPLVRNRLDDRVQRSSLEARREPSIGFVDRASVWEEDVIGDPFERPSGVLVGIGPGVMDVEGRTVVDEPRAPVRDDEVRVARRAVRVDRQVVEPD